MRHQTNNKRLIHLLSIMVFFSLLFVGVAGVTNAQAQMAPDFLAGTVKGTEVCDNGTGVGVNDRVKIPISIIITTGSFPFFIATVTTPTYSTSGNGYAFSRKNTKRGVFVFDTGGGIVIPDPRYLTISGKYKRNSAGEVVKLSGSFTLQDRSGGPGAVCIVTGRFKAKTDPNPPPLNGAAN
ncbi:MAG: hypothetical protein OEM27_00190 [Nitrospinota bacterium]|nr:hypothetical protein [Nitrospinota bacterium]